MVVVSVGILGAYSVLSSAQKLADTTIDRVQAINIAREGIEIVKNIRDSNYIQYPGSPQDCWRSSNYECDSTAKLLSGSYVIKPLSNTKCENCWTLSGMTTPGMLEGSPMSDASYRTRYALAIDESGFTTSDTSAFASQSCNANISTGCLSPFAREIRLTVNDDTSINATSKVSWKESNGNYVDVELPLILTNWKINF